MIGVVLYCFAINDWEIRFKRQINRLYVSGLYDNANDLWVVFCDVENDKLQILEEILSKYPKIKIDYGTMNHFE